MESPDVANRCAALEDVVPQSLRQQELVCLTTSHVNCPRYLRGAVATAAVVPTRVRTAPTVTPAMFGALVLLAAAFTASVVFTFARGGLDLGIGAAPTAPAASSSAVAVVPSATTTADRQRRGLALAPRHAGPDRDSRPESKPDGRTDTFADPGAECVAAASPLPTLGSICAADCVPGQAGLLDLSSPLRRQPVQHRQVLRRATRDGQGPQPVDPVRAEGRPRPDPAAPDPLAAGSSLIGGRARRAAESPPSRVAVRVGRRTHPGLTAPRLADRVIRPPGEH